MKGPLLKYCTSLQISIFCYFILALHNILVGNTVLFTHYLYLKTAKTQNDYQIRQSARPTISQL